MLENEPMTDLEIALLASLRKLINWINDGQPSASRDSILSDAQKAVAAGEAKES